MLEALNAQYSIMNFAPDLATAVLYQILDLVQIDRLEISIVLFFHSAAQSIFFPLYAEIGFLILK